MNDSNPIKDAMIEHNRLVTDNIKSELAVIGNVYNNILEREFIHYFLPIFSGEREASEEELRAWLTVSGGPFNGVNMLDNYGNLITVIPPLKDREALLVTNSNTDNDLNLILNDFDSAAIITPQAAQARLASDLLDKYTSNATGNKSLEQEWITFLSRYNKQSNNTPTNSNVISSSDDDDMTWE